MISPKALPPVKKNKTSVCLVPHILLCNYSDSETSTHQSLQFQPPHSQLNPMCLRTWPLISLQYSRRKPASYKPFALECVNVESPNENLKNTLCWFFTPILGTVILNFHLDSHSVARYDLTRSLKSKQAVWFSVIVQYNKWITALQQHCGIIFMCLFEINMMDF